MLTWEETKTGLKVTINEDISTTHKYFDSDRGMKEMAASDKIFTIESTHVATRMVDDQETDINTAIIKGYMWHPDDLNPVQEIKSVPLNGKKQTFDVTELGI